MIKMDELKPIIEPLLNDENSATVIESIQAIDIYDPEDNSQAIQEAIDANNREWNERFKKAFFNPDSDDSTPDSGMDDTTMESDEDEDEEKTTFEDLFSSEE